MRVLITGGTGFIGSSLAEVLLYDGHEVYIIDNFSSKIPPKIGKLDGEYIFDIDLTDSSYASTVDFILSNIDICYHFRHSPNVNNTLFPLFEKHNVKVVFCGSSDVYGESFGEGSAETDFDNFEFIPKDCNFTYVIARLFNIVGPTQLPDYGKVMPRFIECAINNVTIPVYGGGNQVRSFCDIRDATEMLKLLMDDIHNGQTYNIGNTNNKCTINDLANQIIKITNSRSLIEHIALFDVYGESYKEPHIRYPNTNKINKYYQCKYNLNETIRNICETTFNKR